MGAAQHKDECLAARVEQCTEQTLRDLRQNVESGACCSTRKELPVAPQSARGESRTGTLQGSRVREPQQHGYGRGRSGKFAFTAVGGPGGETQRRGVNIARGEREAGMAPSVEPEYTVKDTVSLAQSSVRWGGASA